MSKFVQIATGQITDSEGNIDHELYALDEEGNVVRWDPGSEVWVELAEGTEPA
jgi:hypothetical protein